MSILKNRGLRQGHYEEDGQTKSAEGKIITLENGKMELNRFD